MDSRLVCSLGWPDFFKHMKKSVWHTFNNGVVKQYFRLYEFNPLTNTPAIWWVTKSNFVLKVCQTNFSGTGSYTEGNVPETTVWPHETSWYAGRQMKYRSDFNFLKFSTQILFNFSLYFTKAQFYYSNINSFS